MLVTAITCTGARPEALQLCRKYMRRQTYRDKIQWLIIDDTTNKGYQTQDNNIYEELIPGPRAWEPGLNTQRFNTEEALKHAKGDIILTFEDDEWYSANYVQEMVDLLSHVDVVGEGNAKYFNLQIPGYKEMRNFTHASLSQTGFTKKVLPLFKKAVDSGSLYFDIALWKQVNDEKIPHLILAEKNLCVGIKGMPGRENIGVGNAAKSKDFLLNRNLSKLFEWVGKDAYEYQKYTRKLETKEISQTSRVQSSSKENRGGGLRREASSGNTSLQDQKGVSQGQEEKPALKESQRQLVNRTPMNFNPKEARAAK